MCQNQVSQPKLEYNFATQVLSSQELSDYRRESKTYMLMDSF